jgi:hypothetical protein
MASPFANIASAPKTDGLPYCVNIIMPSAENDLFALPGSAAPSEYDPIGVSWGQGVFASVHFIPSNIQSNPGSYVVLQTDFGNDGFWFDLAWCSTVTLVERKFALCVSGQGINNVFEQTRLVGTAPSPANGNNNYGLGGRLRFVGKSLASGGSSGSSGSSGGLTGMLLTIRYKILGLR